MGWNLSKEDRSNPPPFDCVGEVGDTGEYQDKSENDGGTIIGSASSSKRWLTKEQDALVVYPPFLAIISIIALVSSARSDLVAAIGAETLKRRGSGTRWKFKGII